MRRLIFGILGILLLMVAVAHITGSFTYSQYPESLAKMFENPSPARTTPPKSFSDTQTTNFTNRPISTKPKISAEESPDHGNHIVNHPDIGQRGEAIRGMEIGGNHQPPKPIRLVPREPPKPIYADTLQNFRIAGNNAKLIPIGRFPAGVTFNIRASGSIHYGGSLWTVGPTGNPKHLMGADPETGRHVAIPHGALCLAVPPDSSIPGYIPPPEIVPFKWVHLGGEIWSASYYVGRENDLLLWIADSKHNDNGNYLEVTIEWNPLGSDSL